MSDLRIEHSSNQKESENSALLEAILQNVADGITVQDTTGRVVYANLAAARTMGYASVEALLQAPLLEYEKKFDITDEEGRPLSPAVLPGRRAIQGEQRPELRIRAIDRQSGQVSWGVIKSTAIYDAEKKPILVVNVIQDITQFKELERRKDEFIAMASHELKTPITSLKIFIGLLQKLLADAGDEQIMHYLERMDLQLNKLTHLIADLLDVSRIQAGKLSLLVAPFDLNELIHETVETLQNTTSTHSLLVEGTLDMPLVGDRDRLGQVLINLLTNAIKYSPHADKICLRVSPAADHVLISVQDFGIGIAPEHLPHIFNQFYRAGDQEQKRFPGLGIGLYITREIVQRHSGQIWVESNRGVGTTFHVRLPLTQTSACSANA